MAHVLIVDDSPTEIRHMADLLRAHGHFISEAQDAEQALRVAREQHPDVVIMDVVMPGMSGFQATRKMHRDPGTAHIPVIMVSVKNMESDRLWGLRQGARDYLTKPVPDDVLINAVRRQLDGGALR